MSWRCYSCGIEHAEMPLCFGSEAPWHLLVPDGEFEERVKLTADECVVDEGIFFIRGHIEIPIHEQHESLSFSVWSSLSERSFRHMKERWESTDRAFDPPYFGWLSSPIEVYPDAINLKLSVQSRPPGLTPLFALEPSDHLLAKEYREGISVQRWHEIVHQILHARG